MLASPEAPKPVNSFCWQFTELVVLLLFRATLSMSLSRLAGRGRRDDRRDDRRDNRRDDRRDDRKDCISDRIRSPTHFRAGVIRSCESMVEIPAPRFMSTRTISEIVAGMAKMMIIVERMMTTRKRGPGPSCPDKVSVHNEQQKARNSTDDKCSSEATVME